MPTTPPPPPPPQQPPENVPVGGLLPLAGLIAGVLWIVRRRMK